jgi:DNA-binding transcriptional regulator GbsR (MarR family)
MPIQLNTKSKGIEKKTFSSRDDFLNYLKTLNPEQLQEAKKLYLGEGK